MLLAFDFTYDESGQRRNGLTTFSISNDYARRVAQSRPIVSSGSRRSIRTARTPSRRSPRRKQGARAR